MVDNIFRKSLIDYSVFKIHLSDSSKKLYNCFLTLVPKKKIFIFLNITNVKFV